MYAKDAHLCPVYNPHIDFYHIRVCSASFSFSQEKEFPENTLNDFEFKKIVGFQTQIQTNKRKSGIESLFGVLLFLEITIF